MITVEAVAFMLARKLAGKLKGDEAEAAIEKRYLTPTKAEVDGKVCVCGQFVCGFWCYSSQTQPDMSSLLCYVAA